MYDGEKLNKRKLTHLLKRMSLNDKLRAKEYKVLLFLLPELRNGEDVYISQAEIARQTGMTSSQVSKAVKTLYKEKIIFFDVDDSSWRKEIRLIIDSFDDILDGINSAIALNTDFFFDDDDDDEDDE